MYSYVQEFTIVEVCGSQEEFGDEADSCSEVTLQHTVCHAKHKFKKNRAKII